MAGELLKEVNNELAELGSLDYLTPTLGRIQALCLELRSLLSGDSTHCDECHCEIPEIHGGGLANKHHATHCSLFDASAE